MNFPGSMKAGLACGILGGLLALFAMAFPIDLSTDSSMSLIATLAILLLTAVLYFAMAGGFSKTSQWNQNILLGYCFLTGGVMFGVFIAGLIPLWLFVAEIILAAIAILCALNGGSAKYLDSTEKA